MTSSRTREAPDQASDPTTLGRAIAQAGRRQPVPAGTYLFTEGDPSQHVYTVVSGRVHVVRTMISGRQLMFGIKLPGDAFGELSALDAAPRSASAFAAEPTIVAKLSRAAFTELISRDAALALSVTQSLAAQLRESNDRLWSRNSENTAARVGHQLVELSSLMVKHAAVCDRIELEITQRDLADWVGATREATARALARFRRAGLVETRRGRIIVGDVRGLADLTRRLSDSTAGAGAVGVCRGDR